MVAMDSNGSFSRLFFLGAFSALFVCATISGHGDHNDHSEGPRPGGGECKDNAVCYSHLCYIGGLCAPDGPVEGTVAGGGACSTDSDCFSGYCLERVCAPDSQVRGKVVAGGLCVNAGQCYSGTCLRRRCGPDSPIPGKMAAGGECESHTQCYSGVCSFQRCAPDGPVEGHGPGGGYCSHDGQCTSKACMNYQCSPESHTEPDKVADGGKCYSDEKCQTTSRCLQGLCAPKDGQSVYSGSHGQAPQNEPGRRSKYPAGAFCTQMADCETACISGRCSPSSRFYPSAIADGGTCDQQPSVVGQCKSGQCVDGICSVSYADRLWVSALAGGVPCSAHQMCYSGYCASGKCSSDSRAPLVHSGFGSLQRNRGQVAAGGLCHEDADCYSGYCDLHTMCGPDGPQRGTLASGSICTRDDQCYSRYCFQRRCVAAAVTSPSSSHVQFPSGKVAPGGRCAYSEVCGPGSHCVDTYCKALDPHAQSILSNLDITRPTAASASWNGSCWHNGQCSVGVCLQHRCTTHWQLAEKYASSSHAYRLQIMVLACIILVRPWLISRTVLSFGY